MLHISDLHFGRVDPSAIECLDQFLKRQDKKIDLIIATGDWTQRARRREFLAASEFIKKLPAPVLSVPGNHDIPLYNVIRRMMKPLDRYDRYIKPITTDHFENENFIVVGLTTPHRSRSVEGKITSQELNRISKIFKSIGKSKIKILACHHPIFSSQEKAKISPSFRVEHLMALQPDLILSGHFHRNSLEQLPNAEGHPILHLSAGTALSSRLRGESNSFNLVEIQELRVDVTNFALDQDHFIELKRAQVLIDRN